MEIDNQQVSSSTGRPTVPSAKPAKTPDLPMPVIVDVAGMKQWAHKMFSAHPGDQAADFEKWGMLSPFNSRQLWTRWLIR